MISATGALVAVAMAGFFFAPPLQAVNFITTQGRQFKLNGQTVRLKGSNYYPQRHMWEKMWGEYDLPEIDAEGDMLHDLGLNAVRLLVPYSKGGWDGPNTSENKLVQLENTVNLLGEKGIRSCVTLFDWETSFAAAGTQTEADHIVYLDKIVQKLKDNPYVFMWDVKNEPDHPSNIGGYDDWDYNPTKKAQIVNWLQRMCNAVRARDVNHPVSVGLRWYNNVSDIVSFIDIAVYHSYWAGLANTEITTVTNATSSKVMPILVGELGWPSYPSPYYRDGTWVYNYTETDQLGFYQAYLPLFETRNVAGCLQWMAFDAKSYSNNDNASFENFFGIWRSDYSLKPAGEYYRDHFVTSALPVEQYNPPPNEASNVTIAAYDTQVWLNWDNCQNYDLYQAVVVCKTTGFPANPADGQEVYRAAATRGAHVTFPHTGVTNGVTYYYKVYMMDGGGMYSNGVAVSATPMPPVGGDTCGRARTLANGSSTTLNGKVVTAAFPVDGHIYIEEPDRTSGVRVNTTLASTFSPGDVVNVEGVMQTRLVSGIPCERYVSTSSPVIKISSGAPLPPVRISCRNTGGSGGENFPGVNDGVGPNNIGLYVAITGRVTAIYGSTFFVDDGSNVANQVGLDTPAVGVLVSSPSPPAIQTGDLVVVKGTIQGSVPYGWSVNRRYIRLSALSDLTVLAGPL